MIIDKLEQLPSFDGKTVFLYPIFKDPKVHSKVVSVVGFVIVDVETRRVYSISVSHPDAMFKYLEKDLGFLKGSIVYSYDTITLQYALYNTTGFIDTELQYYLYSNQSYNFEMPSMFTHYNRFYPNCSVLGYLVPLLKHEEIALELFNNTFVVDPQPGASFYQSELFPAFIDIEKNGLKVDSDQFLQRFGVTNSRIGDFSYTKYNFYTTTGRPSNRFGGINFAALNKEDQTRQCFVSRFGKDGRLVEVDFNAYHPRLIASLTGYDFGNANVYRELASQYFNTPTASATQLEMIKEATFRQIYGGVQTQFLSIPFFYAAAELSTELWRAFQADGFIEAPISKRRLKKENYTDIDKWVLFNYFIQMHETESNVVILNNIHRAMSGMQSVPILYTYDSILFDVLIEEQPQLIQQVLPKCIDYSKFPIKIKSGSVYKDILVCV